MGDRSKVGAGARHFNGVLGEPGRQLPINGQAFPDTKGFSARNLKYMRAFGDAWPDEQFVQQVVAQLREKNRMIVEYALRDLSKAIGVSAYQLTRALPEGLKGSLPTIEELEAELAPDQENG